MLFICHEPHVLTLLPFGWGEGMLQCSQTALCASWHLRPSERLFVEPFRPGSAHIHPDAGVVSVFNSRSLNIETSSRPHPVAWAGIKVAYALCARQGQSSREVMTACVFYVCMPSKSFDGTNVIRPCGQTHIFMHAEGEFCSYCLATLLVNVSVPCIGSRRLLQ